MKNFITIYGLVVLLSLFGLSCKQITKSINETFQPNDSLVRYNKENSFKQNGVAKGITKSSSTTQFHFL